MSKKCESERKEGRTHLMVLPLPVDLDEFLLHSRDGGLQLSSVGCEEMVVDEMGVGTKGGEKGEVGLAGRDERVRREGKGDGERERELVSLRLGQSKIEHVGDEQGTRW